MNLNFYIDDDKYNKNGVTNIGHASSYEEAKKLATPYRWNTGHISAHYIEDVYGYGTQNKSVQINGLKELKTLCEKLDGITIKQAPKLTEQYKQLKDKLKQPNSDKQTLEKQLSQTRKEISQNTQQQLNDFAKQNPEVKSLEQSQQSSLKR